MVLKYYSDSEYIMTVETPLQVYAYVCIYFHVRMNH